MSGTAESCSSAIETLKSYKKLSKNAVNHRELLKDKTTILYTATLLDSPNRDVVDLCLDIVEDFVQNDDAHQFLVTTFGIFEALESLSIRLRKSDPKLADRATELVDVLRKSAPPAYSTRLRTKGRYPRKSTVMYQLYVPNLTPANRRDLDDTLVHTRGLVSFVVDLEQRRCSVRVGPKVSIEALITRVFDRCGMKCLLVTKNPRDVCEVYVDILDGHNKTVPNAEYFPEEDTPPKGKSLVNVSNLTKSAGGLLKSAADFWNKSFYW